MPAEVAVMTADAILWAHESGFHLSMAGKDPLVQAQRADDPRYKEFLRAIPSALAAGLCEEQEDGFTIALVGTAAELQERMNLLYLLFAKSKFELRVKSQNTPGRSNFCYEMSFFHRERLVELHREGLVIWRAGDYQLLTLQQAHAAEICDAFNLLDSEKKSRVTALASLFELQVQASQEGSMVKLERFLQEEKISRPSTLDIHIEDDGVVARPFISFANVDPQKVKRQFWNSSQVRDVFDIVEEGKRTRVLLSEDMKKVASVVRQHAAGLRGSARDRVLRDPRSLIENDAGIEGEIVGVIGYGPRVLGLGYPNTFHPRRVPSKIVWQEEASGEAASEAAHNNQLSAPNGQPIKVDTEDAAPADPLCLDYTYVEGTTGTVAFPDAVAADAFLDRVEQAVARGEPAIEIDGISIEASLSLVDRCRKSWRRAPSSRRLALIAASNEESVAFSERKHEPSDSAGLCSVALQGLRPHVQLRQHQLQALAWLQKRMVAGGRGALLADDMGLGKTLTLLALGSWAINTFLEHHDALNGPMLIVCPRVLLHVWKNEVAKFFEGDLFGPVLVLYGDALKAARRQKKFGENAALSSASSLDIEMIGQHKLVVTNYHTLSNHQFALARIPWSVVVVDEAQAIKNPNTRISSAVRCLRSEFRVACTGTPVETSIDNFWSIMDFVSPGDPLKSLSEFHNIYGQEPLLEEVLDNLRSTVGYNTPNGLVMRRRKDEVLLHLPKKTVVRHVCAPDEIYAQQMSAVMRSESKAINLALKLAGLTQHPLIDSEDASLEADPQRLLDTSPKLRKTMEVLHGIRAAGDKVLIFVTRRRAMRFLHAVIWHTFSVNAQIINGEVADDDHAYRFNTRQEILKKFDASSGFDVLILSPDVAGVGLTITSANHVIHYARPWNPAKEAQSSDRVYRMGQLKDVTIHYVLYASQKEDTFDQKLDRLLSSRTSQANDFLRPWAEDKAFGEALGSNLRDSSPVVDAPTPKMFQALDPAALNPESFEILVALVRQAQGDRVVVTPHSHDRALDVIGVGLKKISLVQCKTRKYGDVDVQEAVSELQAGEEHLTSRISRATLGNRGLEAVLAVNTSVDVKGRSFLHSHDIVLLDLMALRKAVETYRLDEAKLLACAATRCGSLDEVDAKLRAMLSPG